VELCKTDPRTAKSKAQHKTSAGMTQHMEYMGYQLSTTPDDDEERVGWTYNPSFERELE
jgi:hypothetical protein